jgi:hypothetical protein
MERIDLNTGWRSAERAEATWQDLFCTTDWCHAEHWRVRPAARFPELWEVRAERAEMEWLIAAPEPLCPRCGGRLSPHIEGVGGPEPDDDNPFFRFIRTLG